MTHQDQLSRRNGVGPRWAWLAVTLTLGMTLLTSCATVNSANATHLTASATAAMTPTPTDPTVRQTFEKGMAFPRWGTTVYGPHDPTWPHDVAAMQSQTHAQWVQMIVDLSQNGVTGTTIYPSKNTSTPDDLYVGVMNARQAGLKVYLKPLLHVQNGSVTTWGGDVGFASHAAAQQWFQSYWATYEPYVKAAASAGASQVSIGAELNGLQYAYPDQWHWLLQQVSSVFHGPLTYEMNHGTFTNQAPSWLSDPLLTYVGVSVYDSLQATPQDVSADQIAQLWRQTILPLVDQLSQRAGKPVLLSEVGYRNSADCLHNPWATTSATSADPTLQGAAYAAALSSALGDRHIAGIYFWAWQNDLFTPGQPAIQAMRAAYGA